METTPFRLHDYNTCKPARPASVDEAWQAVGAPDLTGRRFGDLFFPFYYPAQERSAVYAWLQANKEQGEGRPLTPGEGPPKPPT